MNQDSPQGENLSNLLSRSNPQGNLLCQNLSHAKSSHSIYALWEHIYSQILKKVFPIIKYFISYCLLHLECMYNITAAYTKYHA